MKKYIWNEINDDSFWQHDLFDTIEECINDAKYNYLIKDFIYIGEVEPYEIYIDVNDILEDLEYAASYVGGEYAENWTPYYDIDEEDKSAMSEKLTLIVKEWLREKYELPNFFSVVNIICVKINQ